MTRINTNVSALVAQNTLQKNIANLDESLLRLSTGLRINSGKDDPAGLIASELLRSDMTAIEKGISNSERANQVIATADSALGEVSGLLNDIRGLVVEAANTGAMSSEQIAANQLQIDSSLEAIDRIAKVTTFQGKRLLDGSLDFVTEGVDTDSLQDLQVDQANFGTTAQVDVNVEIVSAAEKAQLSYKGAAVADDVTLNIGGNEGFEAFNFDAGSTIEEMAAAINLVSDSTGVAAEVSNDATAAKATVTSANKNSTIDLTAKTAGAEGSQFDVKVVASKTGSTGFDLNVSPNPDDEHSTLVIQAAASTWDGAAVKQLDDTNITANDEAANVSIGATGYRTLADADDGGLAFQFTAVDHSGLHTIDNIALVDDTTGPTVVTYAEDTNTLTITGDITTGISVANAVTAVNDFALENGYQWEFGATNTASAAALGDLVAAGSAATTAQSGTVDIAANSSDAELNVRGLNFVYDATTLTEGSVVASFDEASGMITVTHHAGGHNGTATTDIDKTQLAAAIGVAMGSDYTVSAGAGTLALYNGSAQIANVDQTHVSIGAVENNALDITAKLGGEKFNDVDINVVAGNQYGTAAGIDSDYELAKTTFASYDGAALGDLANSMFSIEAKADGAYAGAAGQDVIIRFVDDTAAGNSTEPTIAFDTSTNIMTITGGFNDANKITAAEIVNAINQSTDDDITGNFFAATVLGDGSGFVDDMNVGGANSSVDYGLGNTGGVFGSLTTVVQAVGNMTAGAGDYTVTAATGGIYDGIGAAGLKIEAVTDTTVTALHSTVELDLATNTLTINHNGDLNSTLIDSYTLKNGNATLATGTDAGILGDYVLVGGDGTQAATTIGAADTLQSLANNLGTSGEGDPLSTMGNGTQGVTISYNDQATKAVASVQNAAGTMGISIEAAVAGTEYNDVAVKFLDSSGAGKTNNTAEYDDTNRVLNVYVTAGATSTWDDVVSAIDTEGTFDAKIDTSGTWGTDAPSTVQVAGGDVSTTATTVELGNTGSSGGEAGTLFMYVDEGKTTAQDVIDALGESWNSQAAALFDIKSSIDNDGTGLMFDLAHADALKDGANGGTITATAQSVIDAINADSELAAILGATNTLGSTGVGVMTAFEEVAYSGSASEGTGLQFLGVDDSRNIQFVSSADSELGIDWTTNPDKLGQASTTLAAYNADASMTISATQEGGQFDDMVVRFKAAEAGQTQNTVTYNEAESAAQAYLTFTDIDSSAVSGNADMILTATTEGDQLNNAAINMRLQKNDGSEDELFLQKNAISGADEAKTYTLDDGTKVTAQAVAVYDEDKNEYTIILKSDPSSTSDWDTRAQATGINNITADDIMIAVNQEGTFNAEMDFANTTRTNDGTGSSFGTLLYNQMKDQEGSNRVLEIGNTQDTGGHEGGVLEFTLAMNSSTAEDVISTLSNDSIVGQMFTAIGFNPSDTSGEIEFHKDTNKAITSGGIEEKGTMIVNLETDENGLIQTTAADLVDFFATQDAATTHGVTVSLLTEPGVALSANTGSGTLAATTTDIEFSSMGQTTVSAKSSADITSVNGHNASFSITAKEKGTKYDGTTITYVMDAATADSISVDWTAPEVDDDGNVTSIGSMVVHAHTSTKAKEVTALIEADSTLNNLFDVELLGSGEEVVSIFDKGTMSGGEVVTGTQNGAQMLGGADAENTEMRIVSDSYGSDQFVSVEVIEGSFDVVDASGTSKTRDSGTDVNARLNGIGMVGKGQNASLNTNVLDLNFNISDDVAAGDSFKFSIVSGGATFQMGPEVVSNQQARMGIQSVSTATLGGPSGRLFQLRSGQDFSLESDVGNAAKVVQEVITQVTDLRGRLGAFQKTTLETNISSLTSTLESLTAAESMIRDTDFAKETTAMTRNQILVQSGTTVLGLAKQQPNQMLSLLR